MIESLDVCVRVDSRITNAIMKTLLESIDSKATKEILGQCSAILLQSEFPKHTGTTVSGEAILYGNRFEQAFFCKTVLLLCCTQIAFEELPRNCFGLRELLQLGSPKSHRTPGCDKNEDTLPTEHKIPLVRYCKRATLTKLKGILEKFTQELTKEDKSVVKFLVVNTPNVASVDVVLACATCTKRQDSTVDRKMTIWLIECKSLSFINMHCKNGI
jgi:hypothetical protein